MAIDWNSATPDEKHEEIRRIASDMRDHKFFTGKEMRRLPELLGSGESVEAIVSGFMDKKTWVAALTDRRILLLDSNWILGMTQLSIGLDKINAIEVQTGMFTGSIHIEDGATDHIIREVMRGAAEAFVIRTREVMERRRIGSHGACSTPSPAPAPNKFEILQRLDRLRQSGGLTEQEYATERARLLGWAYRRVIVKHVSLLDPVGHMAAGQRMKPMLNARW